MQKYGFNFDTTYTNLPNIFYSKTIPYKSPNPELVVINNKLASSLGLDLSTANKATLFSGNQLPKNVKTFSQAYAGHQFGHFTMLGDGRAHMLGEHITPNHKRYDIQFKGSGPTPYSRNGDGKAVLGPMLREYIISEAMHYLGIATTRGLAVITTGENIMRKTLLPGAILTRISKSHIRVGTFEYAASFKDKKLLHHLLDYTIYRHYPNVSNVCNKPLQLIEKIIENQSNLIVNWMRVGFIHGVMNTDNMSISSETIDYGPCAFMNIYNPKTVFSAIDNMGRYCYINQPKIAKWNIAKLAESLLPLIHPNINKAINLALDAINKFDDIYYNKWLHMMRCKLGLFGEINHDSLLITDFLSLLEKNNLDYTNSFYNLHNSCINGTEQKILKKWNDRWQYRLSKNNKPISESIMLMKKYNPAVIPRNNIIEKAISSAYKSDFKLFNEILSELENPHNYSRLLSRYNPKPSDKFYKTFCGT